MTEDEMIGWYHQLSGHKSEQTPRDSEGQRSLVCYSPWGGNELSNNKNGILTLWVRSLKKKKIANCSNMNVLGEH